MSKVHIIGAGVAGLAAAVDLASRGFDVVVHEAAAGAGGRCRSWHDPLLETEIDNGNHLMLSGNWATLAYLDRIGARDRLIGPERAVFPFLDLNPASAGSSISIAPGALVDPRQGPAGARHLAWRISTA